MANGIDEETANAIYNEIYDFANYAFNKAHAVSYAIVTYWTAYFKYHYPREYMAALLTSVLDSSDKVAAYIGECKEMGIPFLPPDVNESGPDFTVVAEGIRFGLVGVKGVGRGLIDAMAAEREKNGLFRSFQDFCERMYDHDLNRRALENLIRCGSFDSMKVRRSQLLAVMNPVMDGIAAARKRNLEGQFDLFGGFGDEGNGAAAEIPLPDIPEFSPTERMNMERETTGLYLTGHPMDEYRDIIRRVRSVRIGAINSDFAAEGGARQFRDEQRVTLACVVTAVKTKTTRNNSLMAYVTLEDDTGGIEMLVFSKTLGECGSYLKEGSALLVDGRISAREDKDPQIMCNSVRPLAEASAAPASPYSGGGSTLERREERPGVMQGKTKLYLRVNSIDDPAVAYLRKVLIMFPGRGQIIFYAQDTQKDMDCPA